MTFNGSTYCSAIDKAEAFNSFFYSKFTNDSGSVSQLDPLAPRMNVSLLDNVYLTEKMIFEVLTKLDPHKAPGSDGLRTYVLKECALELAPSICHLFNLSLVTGERPVEWKNSLVVPVHKKGKRDVSNYCPISLLCVISKVLQRCIFNCVNNHLCALFDDSQHGFLKGRSTVTQLLTFYHEIGQNLDNAMQSDNIFFDSVSHQRLLFKLAQYGICGPLLKWFDSYLKTAVNDVLFMDILPAVYP